MAYLSLLDVEGYAKNVDFVGVDVVCSCGVKAVFSAVEEAYLAGGVAETEITLEIVKGTKI